MSVIIGVDPHKASHTAVAIGGDECEVAKVTVRATGQQTAKPLAWAEPFAERTWAIESAGGLDYLLAQQLVDAGEHVLDVPPTLASRFRVLGTGRSEKNDPNDAFSVAIAALRSRGLRTVERADHSEIIRLLAKRNHDLGRLGAKLICRLHNALADLSLGGIAKELYVSDANRLLGSLEPATPIEHMRHQLAVELVDDVARLDELGGRSGGPPTADPRASRDVPGHLPHQALRNAAQRRAGVSPDRLQPADPGGVRGRVRPAPSVGARVDGETRIRCRPF
jgi:transposase